MRQSEARRLAESLMTQHGVSNFRFSWMSAKRIAGRVRFGTQELQLSSYYVEHATDAAIRETILHEIAHCIAGVSAGHNYKWRAIALRIGSNGEACGDFREEMPNAPKGAWIGRCSNGHEMDMHRAPLRVKACGICCKGTFKPEHIVIWYHNGRRVSTANMPIRYVREALTTVNRYGKRVPAGF